MTAVLDIQEMAAANDIAELPETNEPEVIGDDFDDDEHTFTVDEPEPEPLPQVMLLPKKPPTPVASTKSAEAYAPRGVKRKSLADERPFDADATAAVLISDLHWWTTEDNIRSWTNEVNAETDLKEITFSEHKVNGKSKGQVYLLFDSLGPATAVKHKIETLTNGTTQNRKFSVVFTSASSNPFKTLPKDGPARTKEERSSHGAYSNNGHSKGEFSDRGSFRGRGRRGHDRGGFNRNFSGHANGGYNGIAYDNNMGTGNDLGFSNRGGMMVNNGRGQGGMRGARGAAMQNMMVMGSMGMNHPMMAGMGMKMGMHGECAELLLL